jgi:FkbM family methyltransferase
MVRLIRKLPLSRFKLAIARVLYRCVHLFLRDNCRIVERRAIRYELDLSEGFDLSVLLFGDFQRHVAQCKYLDLPTNAVVFDVGANFGIMSLRYSKIVERGHVHAFEPTDSAFAKLKRNLELNPELAKRVTANQVFVSSQSSDQPNLQAYSSWKVNGKARTKTHPVHGGTLQSADNIPAITLDDYCVKQGLKRVDFIKIDTDGHELEVLRGARHTIAKHHPAIIFEVGAYVMKERGIMFDHYLAFFEELGYELIDSKSGRSITRKNHYGQIPLKSTIDVLCCWQTMSLKSARRRKPHNTPPATSRSGYQRTHNDFSLTS